MPDLGGWIWARIAALLPLALKPLAGRPALRPQGEVRDGMLPGSGRGARLAGCCARAVLVLCRCHHL